MSTVILKYGGLNGETFYPDGSQGQETIFSYDNEIYVFTQKNVGENSQRVYFAAKAAGKRFNMSGAWFPGDLWQTSGMNSTKYGDIEWTTVGSNFSAWNSNRLGTGWSLNPGNYYKIKGGKWGTWAESCETMAKAIYGGDFSDFDEKKVFPVKWRLRIDGTKYPNYKLLWKNEKASEDAIISVSGVPSDMSGEPKVINDSIHFAYNDECKFTYKEFSELCGNNFFDNFLGAVLPNQNDWLCIQMIDGEQKSSSMIVKLYPSLKKDNSWSDGNPHMYKNDIRFYGGFTDDGSTLEIIENGKLPDGTIVPDDSDDDYANNDDAEDDDIADTSNNSIGVLTTTYKMTRDRLKQLGAFLWGANIFDSFSLVNSNPIENIISCKDIPFSLSAGEDSVIKLGNVDTGVNGNKVSNNFGEITIGSLTIPKKYNNFLDLAPYTKVTIYLPYIGFKELDVTLIMGKTITVKYAIDVITGGCVAEIFCKNTRMYEFSGQVGIDIPITASNRAQVEAGYISNAVSGGADLLTGDVIGASESMLSSAFSKYHYSSTSAPSPACVASINRTCYVIIDRPSYDNLKIFNHTRGRQCNLSKTIGNLRGFTICDKNLDLNGLRATDAEKEEIVNILSSGFFV